MVDQLEEIKQKIDIVSFISEYLPLKKAGRNFKGLCPFHNEKTPSFIVSPERQIWHCFGCQKGGDIFGFLMQVENLEFPEALEILAKRAGVNLIRSPERSEQAKIRDKIYKINHLANEFFHYLLLNHKSGKVALDYVLGRGISKKSIETFSLGWSPNQWQSVSKFLLKKGFSPEDLEIAGLIIGNSKFEIRNSKFYDRFRGRLTFALKDNRGNILGFSGRVLAASPQEAKYINTPETPVYIKGNMLYGLDVTKEAIKKEDKAIVVEGEFDLISSFQAGVPNVVAIKGSALTEGQVNLLKRFTQNINLALDMDLAGDAASRRGIEIADNAGFSIKIVQLPQGKDPDECSRIDPVLWQKAIKNAVPVFDYILDSAITRFGKDTAEGKKRIGDEVIPIINKITNPIVQAHYITKLAGLLGVSEDAIIETSKKMSKELLLGQNRGVDDLSRSIIPIDRQQLIEEQFLAMVLQAHTPASIIELEENDPLGNFLTTPVIQKVYASYLSFLENLPDMQFKIEEFLKLVPSELIPVVDRLYLMDMSTLLEDNKIFENQLLKIIVELKRTFYRKKLLLIADKLKESKLADIDVLKTEYQKTALSLKQIQIPK